MVHMCAQTQTTSTLLHMLLSYINQKKCACHTTHMLYMTYLPGAYVKEVSTCICHIWSQWHQSGEHEHCSHSSKTTLPCYCHVLPNQYGPHTANIAQTAPRSVLAHTSATGAYMCQNTTKWNIYFTLLPHNCQKEICPPNCIHIQYFSGIYVREDMHIYVPQLKPLASNLWPGVLY